MRDCAKGVFDGWSLTPEFYALPVDGIGSSGVIDASAPDFLEAQPL